MATQLDEWMGCIMEEHVNIILILYLHIALFLCFAVVYKDVHSSVYLQAVTAQALRTRVRQIVDELRGNNKQTPRT